MNTATTLSAANDTRKTSKLALSRRGFLAGFAGSAVLASVDGARTLAQSAPHRVNLAKVATPSSLITTSENKISAVNDGIAPESSRDRKNSLYALRREHADEAAPWIEYAWSEPVSIDSVELYWAVDAPRPKGLPGSEGGLLAAPASYRILYWNGNDFGPVVNAKGLGTAADEFNATSFDVVKTDRLRLGVVPAGEKGAGVLEWRVFHARPVPWLPPVIHAGIDRSAVIGGQTYLAGKAIWLEDKPENVARWSKVSGPGTVTFAKASSPVTTAAFSAPGDYMLSLKGSGGRGEPKATVQVHAETAPPKDRLDVVYTRRYSIDSPL